jgi:hypothetical protein
VRASVAIPVSAVKPGSLLGRLTAPPVVSRVDCSPGIARRAYAGFGVAVNPADVCSVAHSEEVHL